jgi:hypothetical protein
MPLELRAAVKDALGRDKNRSSRSQSEVSSILTEIGFHHENEVFPLGEGGDAKFMAIDMACRDQMVAIEFNGPTHYNSDGRANGKTMMKERLLKKLGWTLLTIPFWEWSKLKDKKEKMDYLKKMLGEI